MTQTPEQHNLRFRDAAFRLIASYESLRAGGAPPSGEALQTYVAETLKEVHAIGELEGGREARIGLQGRLDLARQYAYQEGLAVGTEAGYWRGRSA